MGFYHDRFLPRAIDRACGIRAFDPLRTRVCEGLHGQVVEVGFGSGLNVPFYPDTVTGVAAIEPADVGWKLARERVEASAVPVERSGLDGASLPLPDASCDTALSTWTLCTIPDVETALLELRRVLKPRGTLHFVEHGLAPDERVPRWQRRLEPVQKRIAGGCHLTRRIVELLTGAGFEITEVDVFYEQGTPKTLGAESLGVAVRREIACGRRSSARSHRVAMIRRLSSLPVADAALQPIPGRVLDPPPKDAPEAVRQLEDSDSTTGLVAGVGYRAFNRFSVARATLLAAGTTYYVFLALFSLVALGYGIAALLGADQIADYLTRALGEAFPGLIGEDGIDPELLRSIGQTAGIIGLVVMLYSGGGAMTAASGSVHLVYGAPRDPRNFVVKRIILMAWLLVIGPLIMASLVAGIATQNFSSRVMDLFGWEGTRYRVIVQVLAVVVTLALDFLVVFLVLGRLGGIRPPTRSLVIGSLTGAVVLQALRVVMGIVLKVSADKPQYGTLTLPIGILLVLYLNTLALFGAAALTAGIAERGVPIEEIERAHDTREPDEPDESDDTAEASEPDAENDTDEPDEPDEDDDTAEVGQADEPAP